MVTPFFANKGFHLKLEVSLESVLSEAAHQVAMYFKELHQYLHNQISCALSSMRSTQPGDTSKFLHFKIKTPFGWTHGT